MGYPPTGYGQYPLPQQYYRINLAALTWGELRRSAGSLWVYLPAVAVVAVFKLLHARMVLGERFPREVSFEPVDHATYERAYHAAAHLFSPLAHLGFEHFTTFRVPELPFGSTVLAFMNRDQNAYAAVYHIQGPMGEKTGMDFVTRLNDDSGLTTTNMKEGVAMEAPAHHRRRLVAGAEPVALWEAHWAEVNRIRWDAGGIRGPVGQEDFIESWRRSIRDTADFHAARGVYVPVA